MTKRSTVSERALVLAPRGRDATIAADMLREAGFNAEVCNSLPGLIEELDLGAAFVVVTEEAIATSDVHSLSAWLGDQEEWSDLPFVLLTSRGGGIERNPAAARYLELLGNVTFLERPFHPMTFVSLAQAALRARKRQYEARGRLLALRDSEARYRALFDTMDEGFCVIEFLDGPHGPLSNYVHLQANAAHGRHTGITSVVGKTVRDIVPAEADNWVEHYRQVLLTGEPVRFEQELVATGRCLELACFRVEPASLRQVAVIFQDVTARRRAERELVEFNETLERRVEAAVAARQAALAQLHEAQKLETLGQLTGGVAHDINNLLMPITGALDLLNGRYASTDDRAARLLDGALQSADRAKTLVSRLLGFARRQALETRPVDVVITLEGMRDLISSSVGSLIEVRMQLADNLPAALADPNQLELAVLNLCVNARDAMEAGGVITISAEEVRVSPNDELGALPGTYIRLSIADTGAGMDELTLAKAVEPFFSTKGVGRGTGLGLSMVHGLAGQLGGAFTLSSQVGVGTRASLYLPITSAAAEFKMGDRAEAGRGERALSVLLVDDEDLVRKGTAEMLRDCGHEVREAAGGQSALNQLASGAPIDVVVTDYLMPRMTGVELAEHVRSAWPTVPVLLITGYAGGDVDLGFPLLSKPFRRADLAAALEELVADEG
jgi:PAS domain S-box-containing protein